MVTARARIVESSCACVSLQASMRPLGRSARRSRVPPACRLRLRAPSPACWTMSSRSATRHCQASAPTSRRNAVIVLGGKLVVDEAAHRQALRQNLAHGGGQAVDAVALSHAVVLRDQATDRDARELVEQRQHRLPDSPADVLERDIDAVRASRRELDGWKIGVRGDRWPRRSGARPSRTHTSRGRPRCRPPSRRRILASWPTTEPTGPRRRCNDHCFAGRRAYRSRGGRNTR